MLSAGMERSSAAALSVGSPGGLQSRGRRGVGTQRARHEQGSTLLMSFSAQFRSPAVQAESFCHCPRQEQSRDLHCVCGEDDHGGSFCITNVHCTLFDLYICMASPAAGTQVINYPG